MDLNALKLDPDKADGVWIDYYDDASFLIASTESKAYKKAIARLARKHPPHKVKNDVGLQERIAIDAMAEALLLDFKGIQEDGKALKNTIENRRKILSFESVRIFISDQAQDLANFQAEGERADAADLKSES